MPVRGLRQPGRRLPLQSGTNILGQRPVIPDGNDQCCAGSPVCQDAHSRPDQRDSTERGLLRHDKLGLVPGRDGDDVRRPIELCQIASIYMTVERNGSIDIQAERESPERGAQRSISHDVEMRCGDHAFQTGKRPEKCRLILDRRQRCYVENADVTFQGSGRSFTPEDAPIDTPRKDRKA